MSANKSRAEGEIGLGIRRLVALAEAHPDLHSADSFLELQAQLEGAENRIHVARVAFNEAVRDYNTRLRLFPASLVARVAGFQPKAFFEATPDAATPPPVKF